MKSYFEGKFFRIFLKIQ